MDKSTREFSINKLNDAIAESQILDQNADQIIDKVVEPDGEVVKVRVKDQVRPADKPEYSMPAMLKEREAAMRPVFQDQPDPNADAIDWSLFEQFEEAQHNAGTAGAEVTDAGTADAGKVLGSILDNDVKKAGFPIKDAAASIKSSSTSDMKPEELRAAARTVAEAMAAGQVFEPYKGSVGTASADPKAAAAVSGASDPMLATLASDAANTAAQSRPVFDPANGLGIEPKEADGSNAKKGILSFLKKGSSGGDGGSSDGNGGASGGNGGDDGKGKGIIGWFKGSGKNSKLRTALKVILALFVVGVLSVCIMVGITAVRIGDINMDTLYSNIEQSSILYDVNGNQIDTLHYNQDRMIVPLSEMPDDLKNAFIAIEDKTFYKHHGFNFKRMFGAVFQSLTGGSRISGTSTITQQLARNAYLAEIKSQRSVRRKLSEMYIAWRLEHSLTKDQILEAYLNTIYLGYGNYGVNAAARTYFSKSVDDLELAECAALAALPQAPDSYALITTEQGEGMPEIDKISYYTLNSLGEAEEAEIDETTTDDQSTEDTATTENTAYGDTDETSETGEDGENAEADTGTGYYANDTSKDRRNTVLSLMVQQGYATQEQADAANVDIIDIIAPSFETNESAYTYFTDYVSSVVIADLMEQYKISEEEAQRMVYTGGLQIHTTLNDEIQNIIYDEFKDDANFPTAVDGSEVQASMVVTEVGTGHISAMVGGRNASGSQLFNRAVSARQPGSSIKPLSVYGAALQRSYELAKSKKPYPFVDYDFDDQGVKGWGDYITAASTVIDEPLTIDGEEWPQNVTRTFSGHNTFRTALQKSINTCAVKILWQVGLDYSVDMLEKFGLSTVVSDENLEVNDVNPAALGLGAMTYGTTPLDMALAYATFPNGGERNSAVCYTQIIDRNDKVILSGKSETTKVLDEGVAWIMTDLLKSVVSDGIAGNARIPGVEVGGKTGTTNDLFDVWFDGFTPKYAAALWIGTDLNVEMQGGSYQAARLWSKIMGQITGITEGEYREMPANVVEKNGEYFTKGTDKNTGSYVGEGKGKKSGKDKDKKEDKDNNNNNNNNNNNSGDNNGNNNGNNGNNGGNNGDNGGNNGDNGGNNGDNGGNTGGDGGNTGGDGGNTGGDGGNTGGDGGNTGGDGGNTGGDGGNTGGDGGNTGGDGGNTGGDGGNAGGE